MRLLLGQPLTKMEGEHMDTKKTLWKLLWDYDPNGLIAVDPHMIIQVVNPAFCSLFQVDQNKIIGMHAAEILGDVSDFQSAWQNNQVVKGSEKEYPQYGLYVRKVIFPIRDENIVACIMVDLTFELQHQKEMHRIKEETLERVNKVVDKQMQVAQEIASLLGETTAETKVSLLKLRKMYE